MPLGLIPELITNLNSPDAYLAITMSLLPLTALMLVVQTNPYHALVIRGILGSMAALVYSMLGAPDVALTEALMGTLLAISLYAIAVRSSLVLQLGVLDSLSTENPTWKTALTQLRSIAKRYHLRVEILSYPTPAALEQAFLDREIHVLCEAISDFSHYHVDVRVPRLYEILKADWEQAQDCKLTVHARSIAEPAESIPAMPIQEPLS